MHEPLRTVTQTHTTVTTDDGWRLRLHRFQRADGRADDAPPILCVHGHASAGWTFYGRRAGGIAQALAATGRDVWVADLRGAPGTQAPARATVRASDKLWRDLPALVAHLRRATGADRFDGVGHSLGGVLLYLGGDRLGARRVVTIASPWSLDAAALPGAARGPVTATLTRRIGRLPLRALAERAPSGVVAERLLPGHFGPGSTDVEDLRGYMRFGVGDTHGHELAELMAWLRSADARALTARPFAGAAPGASVPTRLLVGAGDTLTTPEAVARTYALLGGAASADLRVLGRATGCGLDYRHVDVLLGRRVAREVVPWITDWLARDVGAVSAPELPERRLA